MGTLSILGLGLLLGLKHSFEPDHIIAVTNIVTETGEIKNASKLGICWGIGHTVTILLVSIICMAFKLTIPADLVPYLEAVVGLVLIYFGYLTIKNHKKFGHDHGQLPLGSYLTKHNIKGYKYSFAMGIVHGLSGSAAIILLTMLTVKTMWESILFILIFGIGTTISMAFSTTAISLPFIYSKETVLNSKLSIFVGFFSILFGCYYISENLFL